MHCVIEAAGYFRVCAWSILLKWIVWHRGCYYII